MLLEFESFTKFPRRINLKTGLIGNSGKVNVFSSFHNLKILTNSVWKSLCSLYATIWLKLHFCLLRGQDITYNKTQQVLFRFLKGEFAYCPRILYNNCVGSKTFKVHDSACTLKNALTKIHETFKPRTCSKFHEENYLHCQPEFCIREIWILIIVS